MKRQAQDAGRRSPTDRQPVAVRRSLQVTTDSFELVPIILDWRLPTDSVEKVGLGRSRLSRAQKTHDLDVAA